MVSVILDVVKQLESEKEHIQELQARLSFTEEVETAAKVRL